MSLPLNEEKEQDLGVGVPGSGESKRRVPEWEQLGREQEKVVWLWCGKEDVRLER